MLLGLPPSRITHLPYLHIKSGLYVAQCELQFTSIDAHLRHYEVLSHH